MTKGDDNHWTADITLSSGANQVTEYYISATSNNNKTMTYPMTAEQGGAFTFWCSPQTDTEAPTAPSNLTASNITQTSLVLSWKESTDNVAVTGYEIYNGNTLIDIISSLTSYSLRGLVENTSYNFYVRAKDKAGNKSNASKVTVNTLGDTQALTAPSNLTATNITQNSVDLSWNASTDNKEVTGYNIYNGNTLITSISSQTSYSLGGLTENTSYSFYVRAKDEAGNLSSLSNLRVITTQTDTTNPYDCSNIPKYQSNKWYSEGDQVVYNNKVYKIVNGRFTHQFDCDTTTDTQAPTAPNNLNADDITETTLKLSWGASSDNVAVTEYTIYQGNSIIGKTSAGVRTFNVTNLTESTSYSFVIYAKDNAGNVSTASNTYTVETLSSTANPNDCSNIPDYQNGRTYYNGDRIVYRGNVYEMKNRRWTYLFNCTSSYRNASSKIKSDITITPNAVESYFSATSDRSIKGATYIIFDGSGRKLTSGKYQSDINIQPLGLTSGTTYYINFYFKNNEVIKKRFIKK